MRLEKIALHCIESMQSIQPKGPYLLAGFSSGGMLAYEIAQQLKKRGESLALLVLLDTYCQNNNLFIRLSRVTRQLFKGRTRALRDYLYSLFIRALLLDKVGIYNDTKRAHRWAHMHYRIKKTAQKTLLFLAEGSLTKTGKKMLGWDQYLVGDVTQYHFPCNHIDLVRYPFVTEVAEKLQPHLDQANLKN
jgi:thioesterase domain-containing protein